MKRSSVLFRPLAQRVWWRDKTSTVGGFASVPPVCAERFLAVSGLSFAVPAGVLALLFGRIFILLCSTERHDNLGGHHVLS